MAVVSGAASGMGLLASRELAAAGAKVLLADVNAEAVEAAAQGIRDGGGEALGVPVDVRHYDQVQHAADMALQTFGRIDILLNFAGGAETRIIPRAEPLDYTLCGQPDIPQTRFFLEANRFAVYDLMRAIEEDRQPVSHVLNARTALEMIYGVYASSLAKQEVTLPLASRTHPLEA